VRHGTKGSVFPRRWFQPRRCAPQVQRGRSWAERHGRRQRHNRECSFQEDLRGLNKPTRQAGDGGEAECATRERRHDIAESHHPAEDAVFWLFDGDTISASGRVTRGIPDGFRGIVYAASRPLPLGRPRPPAYRDAISTKWRKAAPSASSRPPSRAPTNQQGRHHVARSKRTAPPVKRVFYSTSIYMVKCNWRFLQYGAACGFAVFGDVNEQYMSENHPIVGIGVLARSSAWSAARSRATSMAGFGLDHRQFHPSKMVEADRFNWPIVERHCRRFHPEIRTRYVLWQWIRRVERTR